MLSQRRLKRLISYNPSTGEVKGANINLYSRGYLRIYINKKYYPLNRIIWQYVHGDLVEDDQITYKNGNKLDVRLDNLVRVAKKPKVSFVNGEYVTN